MDEKKRNNLRNWIGFWLLGLSVNIGFNIMTSAAHDILTIRAEQEQEVPLLPENHTLGREPCNPVSTGTFLIVDTVAALVGIAVAPFCFKHSTVRMLLIAFLATASYLVTAFSTSYFMTFFGVFLGAFSAGFGDATVMTFASKYDKSIVSGYASGFGASCLTASGTYLLLTFFYTTQTTMLMMITAPVVMLLDYWFILTNPVKEENVKEVVTSSCSSPDQEATQTVTYREKFSQLRPLIFTIMLPLFVTVMFMCFINQGLFELIFEPHMNLGHNIQYRLYIALCHLGILIGQSTAQCFQIKRLWVLMIIEGILVAFFLAEVLQSFHTFIPVVIGAVMEGFVCGCVFANAFYRISGLEKSEALTDFNMEMAMLFNEAGAATAGFLAIPSHNFLCSELVN